MPSITDSRTGKPLEAGGPDCHQAVRPEVARAAIDATRCITGYGAATGGCGGWSTAPGVYAAVGRPIGGKTGTTDDTRSAWFVGVTPGPGGGQLHRRPGQPLPRGRRLELAEAGPGGVRPAPARPGRHADPVLHAAVGDRPHRRLTWTAVAPPVLTDQGGQRAGE